MSIARTLITVSVVCYDHEGRHDPVRVDMTAETTDHEFLVVAPQTALFGPFAQGFTGAFVVIHILSGQPVLRTDNIDDARELVGHLTASPVDWSQASLCDSDKQLHDHVGTVITDFADRATNRRHIRDSDPVSSTSH